MSLGRIAINLMSLCFIISEHLQQSEIFDSEIDLLDNPKYFQDETTYQP